MKKGRKKVQNVGKGERGKIGKRKKGGEKIERREGKNEKSTERGEGRTEKTLIVEIREARR